MGVIQIPKNVRNPFAKHRVLQTDKRTKVPSHLGPTNSYEGCLEMSNKILQSHAFAGTASHSE